jgi:hypothetical protein
VLIVSVAPASAARLTLETVLAQADAAHPELDLAQARSDLAQAEAALAQSLNDFRVNLMRRCEPGATRSTTINFSQTISSASTHAKP